MKRAVEFLMIIVFTFCVAVSEGQSIDDNAIANVVKLASGFKFTEGPAVDAKGNVYFTDIPNHHILVWTLDNKLDTFRVKSGRANGLYFDKDENLLVCEGEKGQISSTTPDGTYSVIASQYKGKRFNQPNDLWPDKKGGVYFTDPKYGSDDKNLSQDGMHVYYIVPNKETVIRVCDDLLKPNGIIGSPNGKVLYVTDNQDGKTYKYDILKDGTLTNKTFFVEKGCDGMTVDKKGNIYITPRGQSTVEVYSSAGVLINTIQVPERPTNVCFGGEKRDQLFITARTSLYGIKLEAKGVD